MPTVIKVRFACLDCKREFEQTVRGTGTTSPEMFKRALLADCTFCRSKNIRRISSDPEEEP